MEYKRLTKSKNSKSSTIADNVLDCVLRLQELEDKIENGTLIELPCPRHTMVYVVGYISKTHKKYGVFEMPFTYDMIDSYQCNWFLTKAEAEEKIKELKDKE